ncbi:MAG: hypothetical protein AB7I48_24085 [Planctomycetaceae bacterium]
MADADFVANWQAALERLPRARFALGRGKDRWKLAFDDFVNPESLPAERSSDWDALAMMASSNRFNSCWSFSFRAWNSARSGAVFGERPDVVE